MENLNEECSAKATPPAHFNEGVAKYKEQSSEKENSQREYKKLNPEMVYAPYNLNLKEVARKLRRNMTKPEKKLWKEVLSRDRMEGLRFLRQKTIGNYIPDFYCSALMLAIEVDGDSHFTNEGKVYDQIRTETLGVIGIKVIRFTNQEVMKNIEGVHADLKDKIALRKNELSIN